MQLAARARTVAYLRVSTDKQAEHGVSLEAQRAKVEAYAKLYDLQLIAVIVDAGESAKTLDRPGLARALELLRKKKADALLVVKLDRLTRSVGDLGALVSRYFSPNKAALLSVGEQIDTRTASGRMVLNLLGTISQWEREAIGERTSVAMQHKARMGEYTGGEPPFGYRLSDDRTRLVAVPREQAVRAEAARLRACGHSLRQVAQRLSAAGMHARGGGEFAPAQVSRLLRSEERLPT